MFEKDNDGPAQPPAGQPGPSREEMIGLLLREFSVDYVDLLGAKLTSKIVGHNVKFSPTGILMIQRINVFAGNAVEQCVEAFTDWNHYLDTTPLAVPESDSRIIH